MISPNTLSFLTDLKENNHREWFEDNRKRYEGAKKDIKEAVDTLLEQLIEVDEGLKGVNAGKSVFRIFRDVRFSKNKAPYKTNMGAWMAPGGRKSPFAGYYLHIEPGGSFLAGGVYHPPSNILKSIREGIDYDATTLREILHQNDFKKHFGELKGDKLKTAPKGYPKDHPDIDLLRYKDFIVSKNISDELVVSQQFINNAVEVYRSLFPLNQYLNRSIQEVSEGNL